MGVKTCSTVIGYVLSQLLRDNASRHHSSNHRLRKPSIIISQVISSSQDLSTDLQDPYFTGCFVYLGSRPRSRSCRPTNHMDLLLPTTQKLTMLPDSKYFLEEVQVKSKLHIYSGEKKNTYMNRQTFVYNYGGFIRGLLSLNSYKKRKQTSLVFIIYDFLKGNSIRSLVSVQIYLERHSLCLTELTISFFNKKQRQLPRFVDPEVGPVVVL